MHTHAHTHKCRHILLVKNSCSKQFCTVTHIPTVWSHLVCIHMSLRTSKQIKYSPKNPCRCHSWKALKCRFELRNEARCEWARQHSLEVRAWASGHVPVYLLCHFGWVTLAQFSQVWRGDKTVALHKMDTAQHLKQSWWALKKLTIIIYALIHPNYDSFITWLFCALLFSQTLWFRNTDSWEEKGHWEFHPSTAQIRNHPVSPEYLLCDL